ncbi:Gfo/Idh/MocA family oxidoreductase, partial [bacterium]|nr:Gfo/Idh/MocA family oxidoreductase [bacterium]
MNTPAPQSGEERKLRLAIVGCGAIAEAVHMEGCLASDDVEVTLLVDRDLERARKMAEKFGIAEVSESVTDVKNHAEAALLALPNHLHASIAIELLRGGTHVLVEKPLATRTADCEAICRAAGESGAVLATGLICRLYPNLEFVRQALRDGLIGDLVSYDVRQGFPIEAWPVASDYLLRREEAGGGVLMDLGIHLLDFLQLCLGMPEKIDYRDDAHGGVEANCIMTVSHPGGA